ncbi:MAG: hypothetical protein ACLGXA_20500 [Acidobacteriota bacterium]
MRTCRGKDADQTLTPLEAEFFKGMANQGVVCCSTHFWGKGIYIMALSPLLVKDGDDPLKAGSWMSLN